MMGFNKTGNPMVFFSKPLEPPKKKTLEEIASEIVKSWESLYPDFEPEQFENLINEMKNLIEKGKK